MKSKNKMMHGFFFCILFYILFSILIYQSHPNPITTITSLLYHLILSIFWLTYFTDFILTKLFNGRGNLEALVTQMFWITPIIMSIFTLNYFITTLLSFKIIYLLIQYGFMVLFLFLSTKKVSSIYQVQQKTIFIHILLLMLFFFPVFSIKNI